MPHLALLRHANSAVQLHGLLADESCRSADLHFGGRQCLVSRLHVRFTAHHGCIQRHAAGLFQRHQHVHGAMLQRLEGADGGAELFARLQIIDGHFEGAFHGSNRFGARSGNAIGDYLLDNRQRTVRIADQPAAIHMNV